MEIDITRFFAEACPRDYSASRAELGDSAGADTWRAANDDSEEYPLLTNDEERAAFRDYVRGFGAWSREEIAAWSDTELNALCIQMVSGDMREGNLDSKPIDWAAYEADAQAGRISGRIVRGDDGRIYFGISD